MLALQHQFIDRITCDIQQYVTSEIERYWIEIVAPTVTKQQFAKLTDAPRP